MHVIWVTAHSGVGKSTLCRGIAEILNCDLINTGEIIRAKGLYPSITSDGHVFNIIHERLTYRKTNLVLIDDFPYNQNQYTVWQENFPSPIQVLYLDDGEGGYTRKLKRGRNVDSQIDYVVRKLRYKEEILPIIESLKNRNLVSDLDASEHPRKVLEAAYKIILEILMQSQTSFYDSSKLLVEKQNILARLPTKKFPFL